MCLERLGNLKDDMNHIEGIDEEDLRRMYDKEGMTQVEMGKYYGVSSPTIGRRMREFGIETGYKFYDVNEDFFKECTKESGWVYGWVIGDGSISTGKWLAFNLSSKDKEVLYKFKNVMESDHPIKDYDNYHKKTGKTYKLSSLLIGSVEMIKDLQKMNYEDVPDEFMRDLIRGFWEAEGSVSLHVKKIGGNEYIMTNFSQKDPAVLEWIWGMLKDYEGVVEGGSLNKGKASGGWLLVFAEADSVNLYHYMYDDCGELYLERKKNRFEELMARRGYL